VNVGTAAWVGFALRKNAARIARVGIAPCLRDDLVDFQYGRVFGRLAGAGLAGVGIFSGGVGSGRIFRIGDEGYVSLTTRWAPARARSIRGATVGTVLGII
jgi:hypothetical protein